MRLWNDDMGSRPLFIKHKMFEKKTSQALQPKTARIDAQYVCGIIVKVFFFRWTSDLVL